MRYKLRTFGDPILKTPTTDVPLGESVTELVDTMIAVMRRHNGVGLAAQQVGSTQRVALIRVLGNIAPAINLRIVFRSDDMDISREEGCISARSADGRYFRKDVERHRTVVVEFEDINRQKHHAKLTNYEAVIAQHECDHLDGKCIADGTTREERKAYYETARRRGIK